MKLQSTNSTMVFVPCPKRIVGVMTISRVMGKGTLVSLGSSELNKNAFDQSKELVVFTTELLDIGEGPNLSYLCLVLHQSSSNGCFFPAKGKLLLST
jgi:hypothetical protein